MAVKKQDNLYARPLGSIGDFVFDKDVARVFPDMIRRSVPGYESIIAMTGTLAGKYAREGGNCYDLGCSLGASTLAMRHALEGRKCRIVAVDNSPDMVERCRDIVGHDSGTTPVDLHCEDIRTTRISGASVVVLNFTLQFVPVAERVNLLQSIFDGLVDGGILILSEKVRFEDRQHNDLMIELHHNFKRAQGYSDLEISQKRTALENVMIPETLAEHRMRLKDVGFTSVDVWFQCFNFASMIAIK